MSKNKIEIGGYFEFNIPNSGQFPYSESLKYNSAQSAFFDLLQQTNIRNIWMPKFICDSMFRPLIKLGVNIRYYDLGKDFYPIFPKSPGDDDYIFYVNYFGLCTTQQKKLLNRFSSKKIIFDHSQAFFAEPLDCFGTIYSPRKYLPVAEGGLLISQEVKNAHYSSARSVSEMVNQYQHCFVRRLSNAPKAYEAFKANEEYISNDDNKKMSEITEDILNSLDYKSLKSIRLRNFNFLHSQLKEMNRLQFDTDTIESPLTYPLLLDINISNELISNNIFTPTYWLDSLPRVAANSFEHDLIINTTHLICDHRYSQAEMQIQIDKIKEIYNEF